MALSNLGNRSALLLLGFVGILGCGRQGPAGNPSAPSFSTNPGVGQTTAQGTSGAPAFTMTAQEFYDSYTRLGSDAKQKFAGKLIELSGTVKGVASNTSGEPMLYLEVPGNLMGVQCTFPAQDRFNIAKGQSVRLRGTWPRGSRSGCLADCVLLP